VIEDWENQFEKYLRQQVLKEQEDPLERWGVDETMMARQQNEIMEKIQQRKSQPKTTMELLAENWRSFTETRGWF
jgi:hypothetical protein